MHETGGGKFAAALRLMLVLAVLAMPVLAGGCIEDAEDTEFDFTNSNDPDPGSTADSDDDTTTAVSIVQVSPLSEVVVITNQGTLSADLTGWTLENDGSTLAEDTFTFPAFELAQGGFVRVHSDAGTDTANDLYWDGGAHWDAGDTALLSNSDGTPISTCSDGEACWGR